MTSKNTSIILASISLFIIIILGTILLTSTSSLIHKQFLNTETQINQDKQITNFLFNGKESSLPEGITTNEINHMKDVRKLLIYTLIIFIINLRIFFYSIRNKSIMRQVRWYYDKKNKEKLTKGEVMTVLISPLIIIKYLTIQMLIQINLFKVDFSKIFLKFHLILFPQGNFAFPFDSILIQTYNELFFKNITILSISTITLISIILISSFFIYHRLIKGK